MYDEIVDLYCLLDDAHKSISKAAKYGCDRMVDFPSFLLRGTRVSSTGTSKLMGIASEIKLALDYVDEAWMGYEARHMERLKKAHDLMMTIFEQHDAYVAKLAADREDRAKWRMAEDYRVR